MSGLKSSHNGKVNEYPSRRELIRRVNECLGIIQLQDKQIQALGKTMIEAIQKIDALEKKVFEDEDKKKIITLGDV